MEGLHKILDVFGRLFCLVSESLGLDYTWTVQQIESTSNDISSVLNGKLVTETAPAVCRRFVEKSIYSLYLLFTIMKSTNYRYLEFISIFDDHRSRRKS